MDTLDQLNFAMTMPNEVGADGSYSNTLELYISPKISDKKRGWGKELSVVFLHDRAPPHYNLDVVSSQRQVS